MGDTPKQRWAEEMADRVVARVDDLVKATVAKDIDAANRARSELWLEVRAMIFALDQRTHVGRD